MMWPWPVAKMVDRRVDAEDQALLAEELFHANDCCLDEGLGAVLQSAMDSAESLVNQPLLRDCLSQLINITKVTSSPCRAAVQADKGGVSIKRTCIP